MYYKITIKNPNMMNVIRYFEGFNKERQEKLSSSSTKHWMVSLSKIQMQHQQRKHWRSFKHHAKEKTK
jgi:hypothetical protein